MKKEQGFILPIIIVVLVIAVLGTAGYFAYRQYSAPKPIACTQEAKVCPDGSSVGRTGPNCEFAQCPDQTAGWKTYTNTQYGFTFEYPQNWSLDDWSLDEGVHSLIVSDPLVEIWLDKDVIDINKKLPILIIGIRKKNIKDMNIPVDAENYAFASQEAKFACLKEKETIGMCTLFLGYKENTLYVVSGGVDFRSDKVLNQIISTFKFIP